MTVQPRFLPASSNVARLIAAMDWSGSRLGGPQAWPRRLTEALGTLLRSAHPMFLFWGPDSLCFYNDAYAVTMGPERHPSILGRSGREAWAEIWDVIGPQISQVLEGGPSTWHENQLVPVTRHGQVMPVYWTYSYSALYDSEAPGEVAGVLVVVKETTRQVVGERALREAEQRWRALFEQAPSFFAVLEGPDHRFVYANARYRRLVGREALIGLTVAEAVPEVVSQGFIALLDTVYRSGEPYSGVSVAVTLNETSYTVDFVYQPVRDDTDAVIGIFVQGVDVTERVRAEDALRRANTQLTLATEAAQLGIHEWDIRSGRIDWDARTRALWGTTADEPITFERFRAGLLEEDIPSMASALERAMDSDGDGRYLAEYRVRAGGDAARWIRATGQVTFAAREPRALTGTVEDVSDWKALEQSLRDADRRKSEFLAVLSHELRNPLNAIATAAEVIARKDQSRERFDAAVPLLRRQVKHMTRLLDDLLDISRLDAGKVRMQWTTFWIESAVDSALELVQGLIDAKQHALTCAVPSLQFRVRADPVRLTQVFANLLGNAAKYTPPGGHIRIDAYAHRGGVRVDVTDDGVGLTAQDQRSIFAMFSQVAGTADHSAGGLGVGLALARGLVLLHGGEIDVTSAGAGEGSTFSVWLPMAGEGAGGEAGEPAGH